MIPKLMLMFDHVAWERVGHDVGDNKQFWRIARVIRWYNRPDSTEVLVDVEFLPEKRVSNAHFWDSHPHNSILTWEQ